MRFRTEKPATAVCPRTGSRVFIRDELLELHEPIEVVCPICEHWHVFDPVTLTLNEPGAAPNGDGARKPS